MASSSIFRRAPRYGAEHAPNASPKVSPKLSPELRELRTRGYRGGIIRPHRAFASLHPSLVDGVFAACLVVGMSLAWVRLLPAVGELWNWIFLWGIQALGLESRVTMLPQSWAGGLHFSLPFLALTAGGITPLVWSLTAAITLIVFAVTHIASEEYLAAIYLVRALVLIQGSALVYFAFAAARFPHDLPTYTIGMLSFGVILIGLVPAVLGFTYYVFDFSLAKKLGLTLLIMTHLTLLVPLQYLLHAYLLHQSVLFMPLLYFAFGPFLDVLIFIALYSWGMSWAARDES